MEKSPFLYIIEITVLAKEIDMKKLVNVSVLFGIFALIFLLAAATAAAAPPSQMGMPGMGPAPRSGGGPVRPVGPVGYPSPMKTAPAEAEPVGTALRINFEVSGHKAKPGLYVVREANGNELATWHARGGEVDSGWINNLEITRETVWVEVLYYPGPNAAPVTMKILNHAPDQVYGWVSQGIGHALEVAWPNMPVKMQEMYMPMGPDGMDWYPRSSMVGPAGMPGGPGPMPGGPGPMPGGPGPMPGGPRPMPGGSGG
jgi:hypothetical protein